MICDTNLEKQLDPHPYTASQDLLKANDKNQTKIDFSKGEAISSCK